MSGDTNSPFEYNMNHQKRGYGLIINNVDFDASLKLSRRDGSDIDARKLLDLFSELDFNMILKNNITRNDLKAAIKMLASQDHRSCDCVVVCLLSHGDDGIIYATDGVVHIHQILEPFRGDNCPSLAGKPKLFFIQACRGTQFDSGVIVADAIGSTMQKIPAEADFLLGYSVVADHYSWRNREQGSWYVQALTDVFSNFANDRTDDGKPGREIMWMMTRVNHKVAYEFQSETKVSYLNEMKQMPSVESRLTKFLYLATNQRCT